MNAIRLVILLSVLVAAGQPVIQEPAPPPPLCPDTADDPRQGELDDVLLIPVPRPTEVVARLVRHSHAFARCGITRVTVDLQFEVERVVRGEPPDRSMLVSLACPEFLDDTCADQGAPGSPLKPGTLHRLMVRPAAAGLQPTTSWHHAVPRYELEAIRPLCTQ